MRLAFARSNAVLINHTSIDNVKTPITARDEILANMKSVNSSTLVGITPHKHCLTMFMIEVILVA